MEDFIVEYKLELRETLSLTKILQTVIQNSTYYLEFQEIDDGLEVIKNKLDKLMGETELVFNEILKNN